MSVGRQRRFGSGCYLQLKARTRQLIKLAGTLEEAARVTRVGVSTLHDYGNPQKPDSFMPIDVCLDLEAEAGSDIVSRLIGQLAVGGLRQDPRGLDDCLLAIMAAMGSASEAVREAKQDGIITPREREEIIARFEAVKQRAHDSILELREEGESG